MRVVLLLSWLYLLAFGAARSRGIARFALLTVLYVSAVLSMAIVMKYDGMSSQEKFWLWAYVFMFPPMASLLGRWIGAKLQLRDAVTGREFTRATGRIWWVMWGAPFLLMGIALLRLLAYF